MIPPTKGIVPVSDVDASDALQSIISFIRKGRSTNDVMLVVCNFTPTPHSDYRVGVPRGGYWHEMLNGDAIEYGGSGQGNPESLKAERIPWHGQPCSLNLTIPPLATVFFSSRRKQS